MKKLLNNKYLLVGAALTIGVLLGWQFRPSIEKPSDHKIIKLSNNLTSENEIFTCSMHPQIRSNEPGQCPICGMDLIPLETSGGSLDPAAISMSPTAMQLAHVQTMVVSDGVAKKMIRLNGKVQADERLLFTQSSHIPGRIEKLLVNFTGDFISKGQVIAYIYSPDLVTAQEELFEAQKMKETQPTLFEAAKEKLMNWKLTDKQIEQILASSKPINQFPILANVSGYVTKKMANLGDYIKQGDTLFEIADLSSVWILFEVYESEMRWIKKGDNIAYTLQSLPGKTFKGTISYIDPVIDPKTRVAKARIEAANSGFSLKPGMFASGTIESRANDKITAITIPKTAVMWTGKRSVVYVMNTTDLDVSFIMREVTLGPELGESYVIESGLEMGEEIAVNGTFSIDAAAQLAGKPSMMNPNGGDVMTSHNHESNTITKMEEMSISTIEPNLSMEAKKALQPLFSNYFKMKVALSRDDFEKARQAGKLMNTALGKIDLNLFEGENRTLWMQQSTSLEASLQHIEHLGEIKNIREKFIRISTTMIAIAESYEPMSTPIYIQHCPMANSNKGADWLSTDKEILNPYFGQAMLSCGEITKTL